MKLLEYLTKTRNPITNRILRQAKTAGILSYTLEPSDPENVDEQLKQLLLEIDVTPKIIRYAAASAIIVPDGHGGYQTTDGLALNADGIRAEIITDVLLAASGDGRRHGYRRANAEAMFNRRHNHQSLDAPTEESLTTIGDDIAAGDPAPGIVDPSLNDALSIAADTPRRQEVLTRYLDGESNRCIAAAMGIDRETVARDLTYIRTAARIATDPYAGWLDVFRESCRYHPKHCTHERPWGGDGPKILSIVRVMPDGTRIAVSAAEAGRLLLAKKI